MIGYLYSARGLANAIKLCLATLLLFITLGEIITLADQQGGWLVSNAYADDDTEGDSHGESDSDGMKCNNDDAVTNIGLFKFAKSSESSKKSTFFDPHIKATYRTYGWIPFTSDYYVIQDEDVDLRHAECGWLIAMRFCARYAVGEGGILGDGTVVEEADHGYEPGDISDPEGTCVGPFRAGIIDSEEAADDPDNEPYDPEYDPYYVEPGRLCVYEDSMDGMDTSSDENFFHKGVPNEPPMEEYVERYAGIGALNGGFEDKVMPVLIVFVSPALFFLGSLIMSTYNHVVMGFTSGDSLGCVDIPLAPKPPIYFYQLSPPPPWPQVFPVHNNGTDWGKYVETLPDVYWSSVDSPKHQDYWRNQLNNDWFYPKIGIMLGETSFKFESGKRIVDAAETANTRTTAVLTGDFYGETGSGWGRENAGYGRYESLDPLELPNTGGGTTQIRKIDDFSVNTPDGDVSYDIVTEVYNDEVCAYIVDASWNFRDDDAESLDDEPELIGCVKRPETYLGRDDVVRPAPPLPQVYHPWHDASFPDVAGDPGAVSTSEHVYVWQWLRDDPRHPDVYSDDVTYGNYGSFNKDADDGGNPEKAYNFAVKLGLRSNRDKQAQPVTDGAPVMALIPKLGCDVIPSDRGGSTGLPEDYVYGDDVSAIEDEDYFNRKKNRRVRIHGKVYCMNNYDADGNGIIAGTETDMCAQGINESATVGQTLETIKTPKISDHYEPVTFSEAVTIKIPNAAGSPPTDSRDFTGTEYNLPAGTDINTLSGGNFVIGTRILSNNMNIACSKELGEITEESYSFSSGGETMTGTQDVQEILPTTSVECSQLGGKYYRDFPDRYRGETIISQGSGRYQLMRRVDRDGNPPNKVIRRSGVMFNETDVPTEGGDTATLDLPPPIDGECPLALMSDNVTFRQQMSPTRVCLVNSDGSPDETTVPGGTLLNVPIAERRYFPPDPLRGESLMVHSTLEQGIELGYCVAMPPSVCPNEDPAVGAGKGANDGVASWPAGDALPYCDPDTSCPVEEVGSGVVEGECKLGFGAKATICGGDGPCYTSGTVSSANAPTRRCTAKTSLFDSIGEWGDIIADCEPLTCPSVTTTFTIAGSGDNLDISYRCDWPETEASNADGQSWAGATHNSHYNDVDPHSGVGCGGTTGPDGITHESRRKRCKSDGTWEGFTCSWDQNQDSLNNGGCGGSISDN